MSVSIGIIRGFCCCLKTESSVYNPYWSRIYPKLRAILLSQPSKCWTCKVSHTTSCRNPSFFSNISLCEMLLSSPKYRQNGHTGVQSSCSVNNETFSPQEIGTLWTVGKSYSSKSCL